MEIEKEIQREYNPAHPNFERWQLARDISDERAKFIERLLSTEIILEGKVILDIGAGEGNTSKLFSRNNIVISLEPKFERIKKIPHTKSLLPVLGDGLKLPFKRASFNFIILQDVIEHLIINKNFVKQLYNLLNEGGIVYLSTPNRFSLLNIISDPHWGIPCLCLFKRDQIKKYFLKFFRKNDYNRKDIAELLSLNDLIKLFGDHFQIKVNTTFSVNYLLNGGKGLVWSKFHLKLLKIVKVSGLKQFLKKITNDKPGFINKFFTPTFYLLLKKK